MGISTRRHLGREGGGATKLAHGLRWGGRSCGCTRISAPRGRRLVRGARRRQEDLQPSFPLDVAAVHAPVLGLYGAEDTGIPLDTVERMRTEIAAVKGTSRIDVFDAAPHGFHADYRPSYREAAAREGWPACSPGSSNGGVAHRACSACRAATPRRVAARSCRSSAAPSRNDAFCRSVGSGPRSSAGLDHAPVFGGDAFTTWNALDEAGSRRLLDARGVEVALRFSPIGVTAPARRAVAPRGGRRAGPSSARCRPA
jgi:hypothetical protein